MKHQYFGDVNDYRKYGLLRTLQGASGLRLGVCWMLTPDDDRRDGNFITYLDQAVCWRGHDPSLFDELSATVPAGRRIGHVRERRFLGDAVFAEEYVPDDRERRAAYFADANKALATAELVFFDPDNGIEIKSCPAGRKDSSKYVMWKEIADVYSTSRSVLIYQHFRREERNAFITRTAGELRDNTAAASITCFRTANVGFFLASQPAHESRLRSAAAAVERNWRGQIQAWYYPV